MMSLSELLFKFILIIGLPILPIGNLYCQTLQYDTLVAASPAYKKSTLHKMVMGSHYRKVWSTPVPVKKFYKDSIRGGLTFIKPGGDLQTISLKYKDSSGHHYTLRLIDKDQSKFLPSFWRRTIAGNITNDLTSALFPYAPLLIHDLMGTTSRQPELIGLYAFSNDTSYTDYIHTIKGRSGFLYRSYKPISYKVLSTEEFLEKRFNGPTPVDSLLFLEQRLFDFLVGDFDRHRDQWEWELKTINDHELTIPISKDHDMAFSKFKGGLIPFLLTKAQPIMQQYNGRYEIKSLAKVGKYLDHLLLAGLSEKDYIYTASRLQNRITDSLILHSVKKLPDTIFNQVGSELIKNLKLRRDKLTEAAAKYYKLLNKKVTIAGTDANEKVTITIIGPKETWVEITSNHNILVKKKYTHPITKEISIYALGAKDKIKLIGHGKNKIRINIYGGLQEDHYEQNELSNISNIHIYDTKKGNKIVLTKKIKKHLKRKSTKYNFEREGF